jgi:hypothetical protein
VGEAGASATVWGMIDAELVRFPVVADELNAAIVTFPTTRAAAEACMGSDAFEVVDAGGAVEVIVALFEYRRGDWAPCNSLDIAFPVRPVRAPDREAGIYMCPSLVNHPFNSEAAYWSMGVRRALGDLDVAYDDDTVTFTARDRGGTPSTVRLPRGVRRDHRRMLSTSAYTSLEGRAYAIPFEMELPASALDVAAVEITLGDGAIADTLRSLGLPAPLTYAGWAEGCTGRFHAGVQLPG